MSRTSAAATLGRMGDVVADNGRSVQDFVAGLDEPTAHDAHALIEVMQRLSGHEPQLLNVGTIGFDSYHFRYESGREGDCHALGFYPRTGKITVYLMDGTARHSELLDRLGKHSSTRVCVSFKRLTDIDLPTLESILRDSYDYLKAHDGQVQRAQ